MRKPRRMLHQSKELEQFNSAAGTLRHDTRMPLERSEQRSQTSNVLPSFPNGILPLRHPNNGSNIKGRTSL